MSPTKDELTEQLGRIDSEISQLRDREADTLFGSVHRAQLYSLRAARLSILWRRALDAVERRRNSKWVGQPLDGRGS
jgi:hypothetical protein